MIQFLSEFLIILALLVLNGAFALAEIAIVSARKPRLQQLAAAGNSAARTALKLAENPNQFLATTQIGITLVGIFAGAYGGATLSVPVAAYFAAVPVLAPYSETLAFALVVLLVTYLSLIVGELVPKRLGLNNAERMAVLMAPPMHLLSRFTAPIVWFLGWSTELVLRLLRAQPSTEPSVTEEEIKVMIEQGKQIGIFDAAEQDMFEGVLRLDDQPVSSVMTPRPQIVWLDISDTTADLYATVQQSHLSRFPVADGDLDSVLGIVYAKDLLTPLLQDQPLDLMPLLRPPLFMPESITVLKALELFKREHTHIALVFDEYGGIEGLVTSNDILESIVGDMSLFETAVPPQAIQREDGSWLVDGLLPIDEFKTLFQLHTLLAEDDQPYQTVGGFVIHVVGHIPRDGDQFVWHNLHCEVVDMDGRRVDKLLVQPRP